MSSKNTTTTETTTTTSPMTTITASTPTITATAPVSITINANTSDSTTFNTSWTETDNGTTVVDTTLSFTAQSTESSFPLVPVITAAVLGSVLLVFCILLLVVVIRRWYNKTHPPPPLPVLDPHGLIKHNSLGRRPPNPHLPLPVNPLPDPTPTPTPTSFTGAWARESGDRNVYANIDDKHCSIGTDVLPANDRPDSLPPFAPPPPPSSPTSPVSAQTGPGTFESVYIPMDLTNPQNPARVPERDPEVGAEAEVVYTAPDLQPPPPCLPSSSGYVNVPGPDPQDQQQQQQQQHQDGQGTGAGHYQNLSPTGNNYSNVFTLGPPPPDSGDGAGGAAAAKMASPEKVAATLRSDPPSLVKLPPVPSCKTASGTSPQSNTRRSPLAQAKPANQASKTTPKPSPKPSPKPRPTVAHKLQESPRMQMSRLLAAQASKEAEGKTGEEGGSDSDSENYENLKDQKKNKNALNNVLKPSPKGRGQAIANGSGPPPTEAETIAPPWVKQKKTKTTAKAVVRVARTGTSDGQDSELMQKLARRRRDES